MCVVPLSLSASDLLKVSAFTASAVGRSVACLIFCEYREKDRICPIEREKGRGSTSHLMDMPLVLSGKNKVSPYQKLEVETTKYRGYCNFVRFKPRYLILWLS